MAYWYVYRLGPTTEMAGRTQNLVTLAVQLCQKLLSMLYNWLGLRLTKGDNGDNPERTSIFMNQVPSSLAARPYLMGGGGEGGSSS